MQNSATIIFAICVAGILVFIVPMVALTYRVDNVAQENIQLIVDEFVIDVANTGVLNTRKYKDFEGKLNATGENLYDIEIELQYLDENPGKKTAQANYTKIGENVYYSEYNTQILPKIRNTSRRR